jgi:hypothetical protein
MVRRPWANVGTDDAPVFERQWRKLPGPYRRSTLLRGQRAEPG